VDGHHNKFFSALRTGQVPPLFVPAPLPTVFIDRRLNSVGLLFCDI